MSDAAPSTPTFNTCGQCGLRSTLAAVFKRDKSVRPPRSLCPGCALDARLASAARVRMQLLFGVSVWLAIALLMPHAWAVANLFIWIPLLPLSMVCHELGHAVAARLLGLDVFRIVLGIGPVRFERRWLGFRWEVRRYFTSGQVRTAAGDVPHPLTRTLAMIAAGPLANLLLCAACILVLEYSVYVEDWAEGPAPLAGFALINLALGIGNLFPFKTASGGDSDGRAILLGVLKPTLRRKQIRDAYYFLKFMELRRAQRWDEATTAARAAIDPDPENPLFLTLLGITYIDDARYADARAAFASALARSTEAASTAMQQNNLAYVSLAAVDVAELARGAELSAGAYDALPWEPAVAGTRAGYLILDGRFAEAAEAIERTLGREMLDRDRKETLYTLALAHECGGNRARAAELRAAAERLAGDALRCVERVCAARLAAAPTAGTSS